MTNPFRDRTKRLRHKVPKALPCPKCGSRKRIQGYGFAAGGLSAYEYCTAQKCGTLLGYHPDVDGLDETTAAEALARAKKFMHDLWGDKLDAPKPLPEEA